MTHTHPNPAVDRFVQWGALALVGIMLLAALLQAVLVLVGAPGGFLLAALLTLLLTLPVLMLTAVAPTVEVGEAGLVLRPRIWKDRLIAWDNIQAVKPYPLLPTRDAETNRRTVVGKKNYRPAEGIMLVIPGLPPQYRIAGFFAGEGGQPVIALTNRAHTDYDRLVKAVLKHSDEGIQALDDSNNH